MPRNMSFALTTAACRNYEKTVTRRNGWWDVKPGEIIQQVEKGMGLAKGETVKKIHQIQIIGTRSEAINELVLLDRPEYGPAEMILEGFPGRDPMDFVNMYCAHNKCHNRVIVNRIEFRYYLTGPAAERIAIPARIGVCPGCGQALTVEPYEHYLDTDGTMICSGYTLSCATQPDPGDESFEYDENHGMVNSMTYIYWMPIQERIDQYLKDTFRFEL